MPTRLDIHADIGTLPSVNTTTPYKTTCPECGDGVEVYPDFDTGPDFELCGSCWLVKHSWLAAQEHVSKQQEQRR